MRWPCWCTEHWQIIAHVLHNNRIKFPKEFFHHCSVYQHGHCDVTWDQALVFLLHGSKKWWVHYYYSPTGNKQGIAWCWPNQKIKLTIGFGFSLSRHLFFKVTDVIALIRWLLMIVCEKWVNDSVNSIGLWLAENGVWFEFMIGCYCFGFGFSAFISEQYDTTFLVSLVTANGDCLIYPPFFVTLFIYVGSALSTPFPHSPSPFP